jgi:tetratricopeptide (TPR) repeat protein
MREYTKAVSFYEKGLEIQEKTLPADHPDLAAFYIHIGLVYHKMARYSKALSYYEKALEIRQKNIAVDPSRIKSLKKVIEVVKKNL